MNHKIVKLVIVAAAAVMSVAGLFAESKTFDGVLYKLKASRDGSIYKKGEIAEFLLTAERDGKPFDGVKAEAHITKDTVLLNPDVSSTSETVGGKCVFKASLNEAGFLKCEVRVKKSDGKDAVVLLASAAFNPYEIKPSMPAPTDFDKFWSAQKKLLSDTPMNLKMTRVQNKDKEIEIFDVEADIPEGGKMRGYLTMPAGAAAKSLPAVVIAHGAGVRSSNMQIHWAKKGMIALDFNAHGLENGKDKAYYKGLSVNELADYRTRNMDDKNKIYFRTIYLRLMRAMDVVMSLSQFDGRNLGVFGGSQGGGQALAAAALYPEKVKAICAMYPAICDHTGFIANRVCGWPHFAKKVKSAQPTAKLVDGARYIDGMNFASRIKCPVVFMINYADNVCEPTTGYAVYNQIFTPKTLIINEESRHTPTSQSVKKAEENLVRLLKTN